MKDKYKTYSWEDLFHKVEKLEAILDQVITKNFYSSEGFKDSDTLEPYFSFMDHVPMHMGDFKDEIMDILIDDEELPCLPKTIGVLCSGENQSNNE